MTVHLRFVAASLVALSVAGGGGVARADSSQARAHFEKGRRYFLVDEYRKAIDEFKAAYVQKPDPAFLYNVAECYRRLDEPKDAIVYYRRFLSQAPASDPARANAQRRVSELEAAASSPAQAPAPPLAGTDTTAMAPPRVEAASASAPASILAAPAPETAAPAASRPLYNRGWFWIGVGAVVAAGAVVAIWALSGQKGAPSTPLGNQPAFQDHP
jgi:tetratricopeptide (TPR) repeat protein